MDTSTWLVGAPCSQTWAGLECCPSAKPFYWEERCHRCAKSGCGRRLSEAQPLISADDASRTCSSGSSNGTTADYEVCEVVSIGLRDKNLSGTLDLDRLCDVRSLSVLDLGSSEGCVQCTDATPKAGERCCNNVANVISPARDKECAGLNRLTSLDLSRNNMDGALPLSLLLNQDLNSIHLEGNKFEYPDAEEDEAALDALVRLCNRPGMDCDGLPPTNCDAFGSKRADGSDDGSTYMVRVDNPNRCLRCEDVVLPIVMISVACVVVVIGMGLYIFLIRKYRHHLKKWVSTVAIFFTHLQTIGIVGNLKLHWPPPVEATMAWATFSVFENTETLRPECLVKDLAGVSPFFLFSIMMAAAIAMVMIGAVSLSFVVSSLRRACCGRPRATTAGPSIVQSYRERISQQPSSNWRTSIADEHRCGGRPSVSCEHGLGGARASTAVEIDTGSLPLPPSPPQSLGERADNAVDTMQFMLGVFFSIQVATAWRVAIKLLSRINQPDPWAKYGGAVGAVLLVLELGFMSWYYVCIRKQQLALRLLGITRERLQRRVDFLEDRWADHATYWQLAVWFRQVSLTLIVNLPDIAIAVAIADAEASTLSRPIVWVHAGLAVVLLAGCWRWHHRTHPYEYRFQNQLESWLYFSAIAVVIMAGAYTVVDALQVTAAASETLGWVMFVVLVGSMLASAAWLLHAWCKGRLRDSNLYAEQERVSNYAPSVRASGAGGGFMLGWNGGQWSSNKFESARSWASGLHGSRKFTAAEMRAAQCGSLRVASARSAAGTASSKSDGPSAGSPSFPPMPRW